jgi:hypothetical protein
MQFGQPLQPANSFRAVLRLTPYARPRDAHGAEAESMNGDLAADYERPRPARV